MEDKKELPRPKEITEQLSIDTDSLLDIDVDRISNDSLNKMARSNPSKYEVQMLGVMCKRFDITIEELLCIIKQREIQLKRLKSKKDI